MKNEQEYIRDLTEIRTMMERSTKFVSLAGWSGVLVGLYALAGSYIAYRLIPTDTDAINYMTHESSGVVLNLLALAIVILILAIATAIFLSYRKAKKGGEKLWTPTSRRLIINMAIPLGTGGLFIIILFFKGLIGLIIPSMLIFYGLTLINASKYTFEEIKSLGIIEILLGLTAAYYMSYGLLLWGIGFGIVHVIYGIYLHQRYEKK
jgi:hypothetical protein